MTPYLLVFFILTGNAPTQVVQPLPIAMFPSEETCAEAIASAVEKVIEAGHKEAIINGACVSSGFKVDAI